MKSWLKDNDIEIFSTHNEGKLVSAGRFIRSLKNTTYKHVTSISQNVYIDQLDDIINEHNVIDWNEACLCKVKHIYIHFNKNNDKEDHKFEIGDHAKESNIEFAKGYTLNWS